MSRKVRERRSLLWALAEVRGAPWGLDEHVESCEVQPARRLAQRLGRSVTVTVGSGVCMQTLQCDWRLPRDSAS